MRKARRERWEAFRAEQKAGGPAKGFTDYYRGWDLFEDDPDEELFSGDKPAAVQVGLHANLLQQACSPPVRRARRAGHTWLWCDVLVRCARMVRVATKPRVHDSSRFSGNRNWNDFGALLAPTTLVMIQLALLFIMEKYEPYAWRCLILAPL
eukprot:314239-Pleurochrysis_carterae.AAC.1